MRIKLLSTKRVEVNGYFWSITWPAVFKFETWLELDIMSPINL